jgi:hypothetical protein
MGKQASVQRLSTLLLKIQLLLLILMVPAGAVGCRGPWFKRPDNFEPLIVAEQPETRTPRGLISSRLRPSKPFESRTGAPRPNTQSRSISDDSQELAAGDELPSEHQELFKKQLQAIENMRSLESEDLLANQEVEAPAEFSMSDETEAVKPPEAAPKPSTANLKNAIPGKTKTNKPTAATSDAGEAKSPHPLSRDGSRMADSQARAQTQENSKAKPQAKTEPKTETPAWVADPQTPQADLPVAQAAAVTAVAPASSRDPSPPTGEEPPKTDWRELVQEAIAALQAEADGPIAPSPDQKLALAVNQRLLSLAAGDLEAAMAPIEDLQPHEQEFFQHELQGLHATTDSKGNPVLNRRWTLALQSHRKAQMHLAAVSNLEVQNATFCTEVDDFGIITKIPQYHFRPDQELLLYCELDNFVSEPVKDGFETQLQGSYEIVDNNGRRVADQLLPMDAHVCRNQRRDYFIAYHIYMPKDAKPGRYTLKLTIEDMKGRKFGQSAIDFQIVQ